ncbi:helicase-related protein [Planomonospora sp. ID82291]|uniref:helicase-related protein n=1 Tax=Planomonospora sp. ID82291 TaxID=2738136 RepID=UPI0018C3E383|nr:helicase-related protein [Planomonospora sp. ID82291]MBG0818972.1 DEAD/DEAH box helicase family protein [Planomonospora sp. ID82291]
MFGFDGWDVKARRGLGASKFDADLHPRDRKGRFIETGAEVTVWGGGRGTVVKNVGGGRIEVRMADGSVQRIHRNYLTVQARPDGSKPTGKTSAAPKAMKVEQASADATDFAPATPDGRVPVKNLTRGQAVIVYGRVSDPTGEGGDSPDVQQRVGIVRGVRPGEGGGWVVRLAEADELAKPLDIEIDDRDALARVMPDERVAELVQAIRDGKREAAELAQALVSDTLAEDDREADWQGLAPGAGWDAWASALNEQFGTNATGAELQSVYERATADQRIRNAATANVDVDNFGQVFGDALQNHVADAMDDLGQNFIQAFFGRDRRFRDTFTRAARDRAYREIRGEGPAGLTGREQSAQAPAAPSTVVPGDLERGDRVTFDVPVTAANAERFATSGAKNPPRPGSTVTVRGVVDGVETDMFGDAKVHLRREGAQWQSSGGGGRLDGDGLEWALDESHAVHKTGKAQAQQQPRRGAAPVQAAPQGGLFSDVGREAAGTEDMFTAHERDAEQAESKDELAPAPGVFTSEVEQRIAAAAATYRAGLAGDEEMPMIRGFADLRDLLMDERGEFGSPQRAESDRLVEAATGLRDEWDRTHAEQIREQRRRREAAVKAVDEARKIARDGDLDGALAMIDAAEKDAPSAYQWGRVRDDVRAEWREGEADRTPLPTTDDGTPPSPEGMTPGRRARLVASIEENAAGYAWSGDPGRYIAEGAGEQGRPRDGEKAWIDSYIAAHPEVLKFSDRERERRRKQREAREEQQQREARKLASRSHGHFQAGEYEQALALIDQAEDLSPNAQRWEAIREEIREAMAAQDETAADGIAGEPDGAEADDRPVQTMSNGQPIPPDLELPDPRTLDLSKLSEAEKDELGRRARNREVTDRTAQQILAMLGDDGLARSRAAEAAAMTAEELDENIRRVENERARTRAHLERQPRRRDLRRMVADITRRLQVLQSEKDRRERDETPQVDTNRDDRVTVSSTIGAPKTGPAPTDNRPAEGDDSERVQPDRAQALGDVPADRSRRAGRPGRALRGAGEPGGGPDRGPGGGDGRDGSGRGELQGEAGQAGERADTRPGDRDGRRGVPARRAGSRGRRAAAEVADPGAFRPVSQEDLAPSGEKAKARANIAAVRLLRQLQAEDRPATEEEKRVLARWSGWGSLPIVFESRPVERAKDFRNDDGSLNREKYERAVKRWESFAPERAELRAMLNEKEWREASRNTLNAHYTDASLVAGVWDAVQQLGFNGGNVLEPGSGVGTFIGMAPEGAHMTGIELDSTTAAISQHLYPNATVRNESFADTRAPDNTFDLTIGNVPFGDYWLVDNKHNPGEKHSIHNHFILKSLALTRPGGLVAVVTSRYTMDSENSDARREMAAMGDLVGAVRLPSGAHRKAAGTDVVTDLLIFRKREEDEEPGDTSWIDAPKTDVNGHRHPVNTYFQQHPENILGVQTTGRGQFSDHDLVVKGDRDAAPALREALARIVADAHESGRTFEQRAQVAAPLRLAARDERHDGALALAEDGTFTQVRDGQALPVAVHPSQVEQLTGLLGLRDVARELLAEESRSETDTPRLAELRAELNRRYDAYTARFGSPSKKANRRFTPEEARQKAAAEGRKTGEKDMTPTAVGWLKSDPAGAIVFNGLDDYDPETDTARKADMLAKRVIGAKKPLASTDDPGEALAVVLDRFGELRLDEIARLLKVDEETARERLGDRVFDAPSFVVKNGLLLETGEPPKLVPAAEYLSGNVRHKLEAARRAAEDDPRFHLNVAALERVLPRDLTPGEIDAKLGAAWISAGVVQEFLREILADSSVQVRHAGGSLWEVVGDKQGYEARHVYGTNRNSWTALDIAEALLKQTTIKVRKSIGDGVTVPDPEGTIEVQEKAQELAERFSEWVWEDPDRAERLARIYNDQFNSIVLRSYDGATPALPGLAAEWEPRDHQNAAVARIINEPATLLAHEVGAGKTAEMVMGAMELRRTGMANKPAIVVPNHMLEQFTREFMELYPNANILAAGSADLTGEKRREFVAKAATNDLDAVILTQKAFEKIDMHPDKQAEYRDSELEKLRASIAKAKEFGEDSRLLKRLERQLVMAEEKLKSKLDSKKDEGAVYFEHTGIDYLFVDEAHMYKNLRTPSRIEGASIDGSGRASDLHMKLHHLRDTSQSGRVVTFATGTDIANSVTEAYVMMRYLRPDLLEEAGIDDFDTWAATFGDVVVDVELNPDGNGFRSKARFAKFRNVPELLRIYRVFADVKTADDLGLPTPPVRKDANGNRGETVVIPASPEQLDYIKELGERADKVRRGVVEPDEDNMLKISGDGKRAALDMRLIDPTIDQVGGKIDIAAGKIAEIYANSKDWQYPVHKDSDELHPTPGALQIVFMDQGTPKKKPGKKKPGKKKPGADAGQEALDAPVGDGDTSTWAAYDELKAQLVARGVPAEKIRYIHEASTDAQKAKLFEDARTGKIAVLIGSTEKMGTGTNVQARAVALHHMDCPWRPADLAQREGRVERQGNFNLKLHDKDVRIIRYVTEGTFDGYSWQTVERKQKFIAQMKKGSLDMREIEDIGDAALSFAEVKALATGNPYLLDHAKAKTEWQRLDRLERAHQRTQGTLTQQITQAEQSIKDLTSDIAEWREAITQRTETRGDDFAMKLGDLETDKRTDVYEPLLAAVRGVRDGVTAEGQKVQIGELGGHPVYAWKDRRYAGDRLYRVVEVGFDFAGGTSSYRGDQLTDGAGNGILRALENRLSGLEPSIAAAEERIATLSEQIDKRKADIGRPFSKAEQLAYFRDRLHLLNEILKTQSNMDEIKNPESDAYKEAETELTVLKARLDTLRPPTAPAADETPETSPEEVTFDDLTPTVRTDDDGFATVDVPEASEETGESRTGGEAPAQPVEETTAGDGESGEVAREDQPADAPEPAPVPEPDPLPEPEDGFPTPPATRAADMDAAGWERELRERYKAGPAADAVRDLMAVLDAPFPTFGDDEDDAFEDHMARVRGLLEAALDEIEELRDSLSDEPGWRNSYGQRVTSPNRTWLADLPPLLRARAREQAYDTAFPEPSMAVRRERIQARRDAIGSDSAASSPAEETGPERETERPTQTVEPEDLIPGDRIRVVRTEGGVRSVRRRAGGSYLAQRDGRVWEGTLPADYQPGAAIRLENVVEYAGDQPGRHLPEPGLVRIIEPVERLGTAEAAASAGEADRLRTEREQSRDSLRDELAEQRRLMLIEEGGPDLLDAVTRFENLADAVNAGGVTVAEVEDAWLRADAALAAAKETATHWTRQAQLTTLQTTLVVKLGHAGGRMGEARRRAAEWEQAKQDAARTAEDGRPEEAPVTDVAAGDRVDTPSGEETVVVEEVTQAGDTVFTVERDGDDRRTIRARKSGDQVVKRKGGRKPPEIGQVTASEVVVGEWLVDDDGGAVKVVGIDRDGDRITFDVLGPAGPALVDADAGETVTRGRGLRMKKPRTPRPPRERKPRSTITALEDGTPATRVRLRSDIRKRVLGLNIESDEMASEEAREAAARLRASQPVSAAQMRALGLHLRSLATDDRPAVQRRALERAASWVDASYARLAGYPAPPHETHRDAPEKAYPENLTSGDVIAIPETSGGPVQAVRVIDAKPVARFPFISVTVEHGDGRREQRILAAGIDVYLMPDLPDDVEVSPAGSAEFPPEEHIHPDRLEVGDAIRYPIAGGEYPIGQVRAIRKTSPMFAEVDEWQVDLAVLDDDDQPVVRETVTLTSSGGPSVVRTWRGQLSQPQPWDAVLDNSSGDGIVTRDQLVVGDRVSIRNAAGEDLAGTITGFMPVLDDDGRQVGLTAILRGYDGEIEWAPLLDDDGTEILRLAKGGSDAEQRIHAEMQRQQQRDRQRAITRALAEAETSLYREVAARLLGVLDTQPVAPARDRDGDEVYRKALDYLEEAWQRQPDDLVERIAEALNAPDDEQAAELARRLRPVVAEIRDRAGSNMVAAIGEIDPLPGETWDRALRRVMRQYRDTPPSASLQRAGEALAKVDLGAVDAPAPELPAASEEDLPARMAAYRAALPEDLSNLGRKQVRRSVFRPISLADLENGQVPDTDTITTWADDIAADGGPGEHAMRHLAVLRAAGADLDALYQARYAAADPGGIVRAYAEVEDRAREALGEAYAADRNLLAAKKKTRTQVAKQFGYTSMRALIADASPEVKRKAQKAWEAAYAPELKARDEAVDAYRAASDAVLANLRARREARRTAAMETLAQVRDLGGEGLIYRSMNTSFPASEDNRLVKAMRIAEASYPSDWLALARDAGPVRVDPGRGYYKMANRLSDPEITLPWEATPNDVPRDGKFVQEEATGSQMVGGNNASRASVHELGHHMEKVVPGLLAAQQAFLWDRTSTGPVGERERTRMIETMNGHDIVEAHDGGFDIAYSGREYVSGHFELLTVGMESLMAGSPHLDEDADYRAFTFGALALLGTDQDGPRRSPLTGVNLSELSEEELRALLAKVWGHPDEVAQVVAALERLQPAEDPLAGQNLETMGLGELMGLLGRVEDDYSVARITAALEAWEAREREIEAEERDREAKSARVHELITTGMTEMEAWAEVYGLSYEELERQQRSYEASGDRLPGESLEQLARRHYDLWLHQQYLQAELDTRGYMLSREGEAAGIDPKSLFSGRRDRARKYASEELRRWFDANGWMNFTEFKAQMLGRERDKRAAAAGRGARDFNR